MLISHSCLQTMETPHKISRNWKMLKRSMNKMLKHQATKADPPLAEVQHDMVQDKAQHDGERTRNDGFLK